MIKTLLKNLWVNSLPDDLFHSQVPLARARELFSAYVDLVEIENHSFCNRTCWFCPNNSLDRRSEIKLAPPGLQEKIIHDLAEIDYQRTLIWSRYHEPLGHESIFKIIKHARVRLPRASLAMVSNCDYLNQEKIKRLEDAGVNRLLLDLYLPTGKEADEQEFELALEKLSARTGLAVDTSGGRTRVLRGSSITTTVVAPVFHEVNVSTRGGLLDIPKSHTYQRTASCVAPVRHVVVDYNGKAMLCCQVRSDAAEHQNAIIGDLTDPEYSLYHLYRDMASARKVLLLPGSKKGVCKSCDVSASSNEDVALRPRLRSAFSRVPGAGWLTRKTIRRDRFRLR